MLKLLLVLVIAIIIASVLFVLLKKVIRIALYVGLVLAVFIILSSIIFPEAKLLEKGKNYILGKSESVLEKGKDKLTAYVITEANETVNKAKEKIISGIEKD